MIDRRLFLQHLMYLAEAHSTYAYTTTGNPALFKKRFAENCNKFAEQVEQLAKGAHPNRALLLKTIARNIKNQNLMFAQDAIDTLDSHTKNLIPKSILDFVQRYS